MENLRLTVAEYAASRRARGLLGGSRQSVTKAISSGRITLGADGRLDPIVADEEWRQNTDPGRAFGAEIARSLREAEGGSDE